MKGYPTVLQNHTPPRPDSGLKGLQFMGSNITDGQGRGEALQWQGLGYCTWTARRFLTPSWMQKTVAVGRADPLRGGQAVPGTNLLNHRHPSYSITMDQPPETADAMRLVSVVLSVRVHIYIYIYTFMSIYT